MPTRDILVSGATGFVGRKLVDTLAGAGHRVSAFCRDRAPEGQRSVRWIPVGDLSALPVDPALGLGADVFINLAAPLRPTSTDPDGLESKAASIARNVSDFIAGADVPRIVIMSSIAASLADNDLARARRYGVEKLAADRVFLERLGKGRQVVILRPPAVYGPGMQGSMRTLAALVNKGLPIPLGFAAAPRYYMSVRNLCDLVESIVKSGDESWAAAAGKVFEPSDGQAIATRDVVRMLGDAVGRQPRLLPIPLAFLRLLGAATGRSELVSGAIDGLDVEPVEELDAAFGWRPVERMPESLAFLAREFRSA